MKVNSTTISDLENLISDNLFLKVEKWNLYLGDAGLARLLAKECLSNLDKGCLDAVNISLNSITVSIGNGNEKLPLIKFITNGQVNQLKEILEDFN